MRPARTPHFSWLHYRHIGRDDAARTVAGWQHWLDAVGEWLREGRSPTVFIHIHPYARQRWALELARRFHDDARARVPGVEPLPEPIVSGPPTLFRFCARHAGSARACPGRVILERKICYSGRRSAQGGAASPAPTLAASCPSRVLSVARSVSPRPARNLASKAIAVYGGSAARPDPCDAFLHGLRNWCQPPGRVVWPTSIRYPSGSRR